MGTWGTGPFENDAALDWVVGFAQKPSVRLIEEAIRRPLEQGATDDWEEAVAAATVVAALLGQWSGLPDELSGLSDTQIAPSPSLIAAVRTVVLRIANDPHLQQSWIGSDDLMEWTRILQDLALKLAG